MDPFVQLPTELLQEVFKHVPTLTDKFKLAAVSERFRGSVLKILQKPMPLSVNFYRKTINGFKIPLNRWPAAVEVLAKRTCFSSVRIEDKCPEDLLDAILNKLIETETNLNHVKVFCTVAVCNPSLLEQLLAKCGQLGALEMEFPLSRLPKANAQAIDLGTVLNNKALSALWLVLDEYPVAELSAAFQSLAPNKLDDCRIDIRHPLDLVQLMREVPDGVWAALTSVQIVIHASNDAQLGLLETLARMPRLQDCTILFTQRRGVTVPFGQYADAVASLFNVGQERADQLLIRYCDLRSVESPGCAVIHMVRVLQQQHPQLQFDEHQEITVRMCQKLVFTLGNTSLLSTRVGAFYCANECVECRSFYPNVIHALIRQARQTHTSGHLYDHQLDKCKVALIVADHSAIVQVHNVLASTINEAQDMATITFEKEGHEQFYITVDCGPCFSRSCLACVELED